MSRNMKIFLGVIAGILIICCVGAVITFVALPTIAARFFDQALIEDPEEVAAIGQEIINYERPTGFLEEGAMQVMGIRMVFMIPELRQQNAFIMLMEFPASLSGNEAQMRRQMEETFSRQTGQQDLNMVYKGSETVTINGKEATLGIYEGTDENGMTVRQASAVFETNSGAPGMVLIFGPVNEWEGLGLEQFLQSMQ